MRMYWFGPPLAADFTTPTCWKVLTCLFTFEDRWSYAIYEVNRKVICTLSELITRYLRVQQLIRLLLLDGNYQQTFWVKVLYIQSL